MDKYCRLPMIVRYSVGSERVGPEYKLTGGLVGSGVETGLAPVILVRARRS